MARRGEARPERPAPSVRTRRVGELVEVLPVRTVVRLADLEDPHLRRALGTGFVLTGEAEHCLATLLRDVRSGRGRGYFLEGAFGSGKSHLMAVALGVLGGQLAVSELGADLGAEERRRAVALAAWLPDRPLLAVPVSLVGFAARETLEEAVLRSLARVEGLEELGTGPWRRQEAFARVSAFVAERGYAGLALGIDELSEFLRSKPDGRAFSEDVRFLQFLGEWAETAPAWILLSAQQAIEETGDLPQPVFGRIRDRYPVRFRLGGGHIKDLIARRLVRHRPEAGERLPVLYRELAQALGRLPFDEEEFCRLYPVHPLTVELLDQLRGLFSEQRGVVDFVHARLAGDPARRIPSLLQEPEDHLLCPDAVVDHFHDRIRERPETAPFALQALPYFASELGRLFPDPAMRELASRLGKVLVAGALCPTPRAFTARELALGLLVRLTELDPAVNLAFVQDTLERLVQEGAYVVRRGGGEAEAREARYACDLAADVSLVFERRLAYWRSGLFPEDRRTWTALAPLVDDPVLPLGQLVARTAGARPGADRAEGGAPRAVWEVVWRRSVRRVAVWAAEVSTLPVGELREAARVLETSETDGLLLLAAALPGEAARAEARWRAELLPALSALHPNLPALLWVPREPTGAEGEGLRDAVALALLAAELAEDQGVTADRLRAHLGPRLDAARREIALLFRTLYLEGRVLGGAGIQEPGRLGAVPFPALLQGLFEEPFALRFPLHPEVLGQVELLVPASAERAVAELCQAGEVEAERLDPGIRQTLDRYLVPLRLAAKTARAYRLALDRRVPWVAAFLDAVADRTPARPLPLDDLYLALRKGPVGLPRRLFDLVAFVLVRSGAASLVRGGRRLQAHQVHLTSLAEADGVASGALLDPALQAGLELLPFLPARLRRGPLTYALQREAWQEAVAWRQRWAGILPRLRETLAAVRAFPSLSAILTDERLAEVDAFEGLLAAVVPSLSPQEGLERVLAAFLGQPTAVATCEAVQALQEFLEHRLERYLQMVGYLEAPEFAPPEALAVRAREVLGQLRDPAVALGEGFSRAEEAFVALRQAYAQAYAEAHAREVGPDAFRELDAVAQGSAARLALALGEIPGLRAEPDAAALRRALDAAGAGRCPVPREALVDRLQRVPACACGFRLDRPRREVPVGDVRRCAEAAARAYLRALTVPEAAERLQAYAGGLRAVGRAAEAEACEALARLDPEAPEAPAAAWDALRRLGLGELRAAWAGATLVVERDLAGLRDALEGRIWRPEQLADAVRGWVGEVPSGTFVRVRADGWVRGSPSAGGSGDPGGGAGWRELARALARGETPGEPMRRTLEAPPVGDLGAEAAREAARALWALRVSRTAWSEAVRQPPRTPAAWESLWCGPAGQRLRLLAEAEEAIWAAGLGAEVSVAPWAAELREAAAVVRPAFAAALAQVPPDARGGLGPAVAAARSLARQGAPGVYVFCVDGMRADVLGAVLEELVRAGVACRVAERRVAWAAAPTTTAAQFEALDAVGFRGEVLRWDRGAAEALATDPRRLLQELDWATGRGDGCLVKWDFVDAKLHATREDYASLLAELRVQVRRRLAPVFRALQPGARVVLCADHGFREAEAWSPEVAEAPRYLHGGESPDEVLAPWLVLEVEA